MHLFNQTSRQGGILAVAIIAEPTALFLAPAFRLLL
jgi:hypothetical protein